MAIPIDDHAIVRGHAVFDTCSLVNGRMYRLQIHLDRMFASASAARLPPCERGLAVGSQCEGGGECGTREDGNNCIFATNAHNGHKMLEVCPRSTQCRLYAM